MPRPVFSLTPRVVALATEVSQLVGRFEGLQVPQPQLRLRRVNRARTVHGSTAIEGNTLTLDMVTAVLEGKRVLAPRRELTEVQNALTAYDRAAEFRPWSHRDLLSAHALLMRGLDPEAGRFRQKNAGVFVGQRVAHLAPPPRLVPRLVEDLLQWGRRDKETPAMIKACVVHYELEFIHPFADGNGRVGRLWQHVILLGSSPVFGFAPTESLVHARQAAYYRVLADAGKAGDCTAFVAFSLQTIRDALAELLRELRPERQHGQSRLELAGEHFGQRWFSRRDYLLLHKRVSTATASRDLKGAFERRLVKRRGRDRKTEYAFRR